MPNVPLPQRDALFIDNAIRRCDIALTYIRQMMLSGVANCREMSRMAT
jgi:hypothetical protein